MDRAILISPNTVFSSYLHREHHLQLSCSPLFTHSSPNTLLLRSMWSGAEEGSRGRRTPEVAYPTFPTLANSQNSQNLCPKRSFLISQTLLPDWLAWVETVSQVKKNTNENFGYGVRWLKFWCKHLRYAKLHHTQWMLSPGQHPCLFSTFAPYKRSAQCHFVKTNSFHVTSVITGRSTKVTVC